MTMPGSVRAAQVVILATFGVGLLLTVLVGSFFGAEEAGRVFSPFLMSVALSVAAFLYAKKGNSVRITSLVLASTQILLALSATARGAPLGIVPLGSAITVIILLSGHSARQWFRRQRPNGAPQ